MTNIREKVWVSSAEETNNENGDDKYDVIQPTLATHIKSPSLGDLRRVGSGGHFNHNFLRDSMVGLKEGVPGIFSGYAAEKVRSSIKEKQPFFNQDENNLLEERDVQGDDKSEVSSDGEFPSADLSTMNFDPRKSIANKHVVVETGLGISHVETGMRFYNPLTETSYCHTSSFLVNLSDVGNETSESELEQSAEQSVVSISAYDDTEIYDAIGSPRTATTEMHEPSYANINYGKVKKTIEKLPRLPPRNSIVYYSEDDKETYFEVELNEEMKPVTLPPLKQPAAEYQVKRYQLIKCIMETEYGYMASLRKLVKGYEEPLIEHEILKQEVVQSMFKDVHEIMQCHHLFIVALNHRVSEWDKMDVIGDVIIASFSKSMVFKAYCNYVRRFSITMDTIKETCKSVPAFLNFLKCREANREAKQSLYHLMCRPLEYIPNIVVLTETILDETPFSHEDRLPLQMALTHLECLCESLASERTNVIMKEKVKHLDSQCIGLEKELALCSHYVIRQDDMLLCETENGKVVKTKPYKIFLLNNVILCASKMSTRQQVQLMTNRLYKVKWCFPISDVHVIDATSGIYVNTEVKDNSDHSFQISSGQYPSKYVEDLLHDLTMVGDIMGKVSSLRLSYSFVDSNKVNEWYKEIHRRLDSVMEVANMNWIEMSIPSVNKGEREQVLFNVPSPKAKLEWSIDFENANYILTEDNNPGWYIQEENIYEHEAVSLRRALPLVAGIQPLFMINPETSVQCVLDASVALPSRPILWIFSGNEQLGIITLLEMSMQSAPHVLHSYVACNERICCAEIVSKKNTALSEQKTLVCIGTMSGRIMVYNALDVNERQPLMSTTLDDSVVSMQFTGSWLFVGLANGGLLRFDVETGTTLDMSNPTIVSLSLFPVVSIAESCGKLWCASGSLILIIEEDTMLKEDQLAVSDDRKVSIKQLMSYGIGVWVSMRKSTILVLYHGETKEQLQIINTATAITRMKNEVEGPIRNICTENIYVSTILAKEGLLWVGVDQGLIVTYPVPNLGGIPTVSGKACVSFHAHGDCVKHIHAFCLRRRSFQNEIMDPRKVYNGMGSADRTEEGSMKLCNDLYTEPKYFTLEVESEPATETSSLSAMDEDDRIVSSNDQSSYKGDAEDDISVTKDPANDCSVQVSSICSSSNITEKENIECDSTGITLPKNVSESKDTTVGEENVPVKVEIPLTFPTPKCHKNENNDEDVEISSCAHSPTSTAVLPDAQRDGVGNPQGKGDVSSKVEIPLTFPTPKRNRKQKASKVLEAPDTNNTMLNTDNSMYETFESVVQNEILPSSSIVQGESLSSADLRNEGINEPCPNSTDTNSENNIYEAPLKVCNDFYATLENRKDHLGIDSDASVCKEITGVDSTFHHFNSPSNSDQSETSIKENCIYNSSVTNNCIRIPPSDQPQIGDRKCSKKTNRTDLEKKSWYVVSIGRGHVDLRRGSKYNEHLSLLNTSPFVGSEPMIILWKVNVGNGLFPMG